MAIPRWTVCDLAEDEFGKLESEGIRLTPQEVLNIQALSLDAMGDFDDGLRLRGSPVIVGGVTLWPLTIAGSAWREEVEAMLSDDDYTGRLFILAYAMAKGRDKDAMSVYGLDAIRAVLKWAKKLTCRTEDLLGAVNDLLGDKPRVEIPEGKLKDGGEELSTPEFLEREAMAIFGTDPDIWRYQLSMDQVVEIIRKHHALGQSGKSGSERRKNEALRKLAYYVDGIRKARHGEEN